jgi:hypothetical protein
MRLIGGLALALLIATGVTAAVENVVVRDGERTYIHGHHDDATLKRLGDRYASFELDGVRYVIYDKATLDRIDEAVRRQVEIGNRQADLGARQADLGAEQAVIGAQQAAIGAEQAFATAARQRQLAAQQRELSAQQRELGVRQQELGAQQRELGAKQREAASESRRKLDAIFRGAVRDGVAKRRGER